MRLWPRRHRPDAAEQVAEQALATTASMGHACDRIREQATQLNQQRLATLEAQPARRLPVDAQIAQIRAQAALDRALREVQLAAQQQERAARRHRRAERAAAWSKVADRWGKRIITMIPLFAVNAVAYAGQVGFAGQHFGWPWYGSAVFGLALESIALFLAWHAQAALLAGDSALRLKLASYTYGLVIAGINYSHYVPSGWAGLQQPTVKGVTFALMSASSPWLWSIHARRVHRDQLRDRGEIEPRAVKLAGVRWTWHLWRTIRVYFWATWTGVTKPEDAVTGWQEHRAQKRATRGERKRHQTGRPASTRHRRTEPLTPVQEPSRTGQPEPVQPTPVVAIETGQTAGPEIGQTGQADTPSETGQTAGPISLIKARSGPPNNAGPARGQTDTPDAGQTADDLLLDHLTDLSRTAGQMLTRTAVTKAVQEAFGDRLGSSRADRLREQAAQRAGVYAKTRSNSRAKTTRKRRSKVTPIDQASNT